MTIILIRHLPRELDPNDPNGCYLPLAPEVRMQAGALNGKLSDPNLRPQVYLSSRYLHAKQTAELLRDRIGGIPSPRIVEADSLTPKQSYTLLGIVDEAKRNGINLAELSVAAFVLHHPRLNQLVASMVPQATNLAEPKYGEAVCLVANSLDDHLQGMGKEQCRFIVTGE